MLWGKNKRNQSFIPQPRWDFFCFISPSLEAKFEFWYIENGQFAVTLLYSWVFRPRTQHNDQAKCQTQTFRLWPRPVFLTGQRKSSKTRHLCFYPSFLFNTNAVAWQLILWNPVERFFFRKLGGTHTVSCLKASDFSQYTIYCLSPYESINGHLSTVREA